MTTVIAVRAVVDGPDGIRDRHRVGWLPTDGWWCDLHPRTRTCPCRQAVAEVVEQLTPGGPR